MDGFKLGGRLNRISFMLFFVVMVFVFSIFVVFWDSNLAVYHLKNAVGNRTKILWEFLMGALWTINLYMLYSLAMRRVRDVGKCVILVDIFFPLYYILMLCIRRAGNTFAQMILVAVMLLLMIPGSDKKVNQYGEADNGRNPMQYLVYGGMYMLLLILVVMPSLFVR